MASDGRILYARWDYIDRFNGHFESLWSANQDGTNPQLVYGNYTVKPQAIFEARSIPGSAQLVFTASAHHSITGGSICLLDRSQGCRISIGEHNRYIPVDEIQAVAPTAAGQIQNRGLPCGPPELAYVSRQ